MSDISQICTPFDIDRLTSLRLAASQAGLALEAAHKQFTALTDEFNAAHTAGEPFVSYDNCKRVVACQLQIRNAHAERDAAEAQYAAAFEEVWTAIVANKEALTSFDTGAAN